MSINRSEFFIPGHRARPERAEFLIDVATVGPGYFDTFRIPVLRGRGFTDADTPNSPRVVIVNEAMARRFWPGESAVGQRIRRRGPDGPEYEIVGVSGDHKIVTVGEAPLPLVHYAWTQHPGRFASVAVRTGGNVATALAGVAAEMRGRDPDLVLITTETLRQTIAVKLLPVRLGAALLLAFGVMALVLAAAGLYGVIACSVSRRTREIGLRMALGARRAGVLGLVMRQGLGLAVVGVALGLVGAAAAGGILSSLLYGIGTIDPPAFIAAAGLLVGVAALATWVPARRARRPDRGVAGRLAVGPGITSVTASRWPSLRSPPRAKSRGAGRAIPQETPRISRARKPRPATAASVVGPRLLLQPPSSPAPQPVQRFDLPPRPRQEFLSRCL